MIKKVAILMGSPNDRDKLVPAMEMLEKFGVEHEAHVLSAHRTPDKVAAFVKGARDAGFGVLIAAAGLAAHLAGAVAANTTLPVIGIPLAGGALNGVDSLYSTVQMPTGIPVATVAINGAANAGILAVEILALGDEELTKKLAEYREELANR
ncbi:MAG TPA: 5-(carboxyamino)imidazole ribonucleotide mutase [Acidimicrobiales bacterium]|nr:5-(carboxyamino)imidazole ribonucleotide mutase [Acidimicrobiales bacterium]